ncbi:hypothetical protein VMCG_04049 [Cytospora schulzeri]|uniref:Centrosomin N-terminal motif 1 domain-containing protein n=1 Tax=Cytospora schulzeri TaxID=448051 RepID=A0A423WTW9_9PEZI|nr:hypothetical protein VMCG_04049 [Valsa malicola]
MSTLHKQNFDLKLELFHRRERQTILEDKIETLEAEKAAARETNETLVHELERRDKAVEEAVHMIVSLEGRIDLLLREREMVRQMEADNHFSSGITHAQLTSHGNGVEYSKEPDAKGVTEARGLARMPSFLSVRTENTENLRNVYLGTQGSLLSLSKTDPRMDHGGFMSPSMSVLSESSFVSIYGSKAAPESTTNHVDSNARLMETPTRSSRRENLSSRDGMKEGVGNGRGSSPVQRLQTLNSSPAMDENSSQPIHSGKDIERAATVKPFKTQPLVRVRNSKEKPTPSRRVITDVPATRSHALPPTPDTMSSSMKQNHSFDDIPHRDQRIEEARYSGLSRSPVNQGDEVEPDHWRFKGSEVAQPPSVTAFTGRNSAGTYYENRLSVLRRPRSADETTISRHRNDWDSGSEPDDGASEVSTFDYWIREGLRPSNGGLGRAPHRTSITQKISSRGKPDLFSFPSDSKGWKTSGVSGVLDGNGYLDTGAPLAPALDALGDSLPAPESGLFGSGIAGPSSPRPAGAAVAPPPAPYRRSSLQARTLAPGATMETRAPKVFGKFHESESSRMNSGNGQIHNNPGGWQDFNSGSTTPTPPNRPQPQEEEGSAAQKRHYPPIASHQQQQTTARPRSRGLTSLFRRSLGTNHPQPSASVPNNHSPFPPPASNDQATFTPVGMPTWERRNYQPVEEASATPPPIMRNRAPTADMEAMEGAALHPATRAGRAGNSHGNHPGLGAGLSSVLATHDGGVSLNTPSQEQESTPAPAGHGHGRRWFGLGRVAGLKHGGN